MSGRCPACGGSDRTELSPGYFQCRSKHLAGAHRPVGAQEVPVYRTCSEKYQESPGFVMATCHACRLNAVGFCTTCNRPVCGRCLEMVAGKVTCRADASRLKAVLQQAEQDALDARKAPLKAAGDAIRDHLLAVQDPIERLLRALVVGHTRTVFNHMENAAIEACPQIVARLHPDRPASASNTGNLTPLYASLRNNRLPEGAAVCRWFAERAPAMGFPATPRRMQINSSRMFPKYKVATFWRLNTESYRFDIKADGTMLRTSHEIDRLPIYVGLAMARQLGITEPDTKDPLDLPTLWWDTKPSCQW